MKTKKIPMRCCVVTKERLPKSELIRVVRTPEDKVIIDETGKANGHGAYLKKDLGIIEKAIKHKILERHLDCKIDDKIYEDIKQIVK
ncbi:MAG: YlxR family protein [Bacilli bacterium]|nr:YlxR family protein [Bacilli bacterium]MDD4809429.1 YlxR family protein [Bacilli bacterium]